MRANEHRAVVEIKNLNGLHMRPAMMFAELAGTFASNVRVHCDGMDVVGQSISNVRMLGLPAGSKMEIVATGEDSRGAVAALRELVERRLFDEAAAS